MGARPYGPRPATSNENEGRSCRCRSVEGFSREPDPLSAQNAVAQALSPKAVRNSVLDLATPAILEMILGMSVGIIDTAMVGRLGASALASVGLGAQVMFIAQTLFASVTTGTTALVARHIGAEETDEACSVARQSLVLGGGLALVASLLLIGLGPHLVGLLFGSTEAVVQAQAVMYVRIVASVLVFHFVLIVLNSSLRGSGDTRTPMMIMAIVNLTNVVLNYILIYGALGVPALGMPGAALATACSLMVGGCLALAFAFGGRRLIKLSLRDDFRPRWATVERILTIGIPAGIEQAFLRVGQLSYSVIIASLGTTAYAAHQIALNAESLSYQPGFGFALAATSLVGQGLGARDPEGAQRAGLTAARMAATAMGCVGAVLFLVPRPIVSIFTSDPEVIALSAEVLRIVAIAQPALALVMVLSGSLRGAGDTRVVMSITAVGFCAVRIITAYLLVRAGYGLVGAWIGMVVDLFFRGSLFLLRFKRGGWKTVNV
jgi:putative MATE family efflux protein